MGSDKYRNKYIASKVNEWVKDLRILPDIANTQPQAAYSVFVTRCLYQEKHINLSSKEHQYGFDK